MFKNLRKPLKLSDLKMGKAEQRLASIRQDKETLKQPFFNSLQENIEFMKDLFGNSSDLVLREFHFGVHKENRVALVYIDGLIDKISISEAILKPLVYRSLSDEQGPLLPEDAYQMARDWLITFGSVKEASKINDALNFLLAGFAILFIDGISDVLALEVKGWQSRAVEEPRSESFTRGPRDGFTETIRTNTALVRRRIRTPNLRFAMLNVGRITKTDVAVAYIEGLADPNLVQEVLKRLKGIDTDSILESGYIEDFIKDDAWTPFALSDRTERPDKLSAGLLEGRVGIIVDNTPFALLVPAVFSEFLQSAEDYYEGIDYIRPLRWLALIISTALTAVFVALTTFHQEMIPSGLALSIAAGREGVPFPTAVEALLMEMTFDFLREAGTRMPRSVGQAVGIVGALVLGQAAVAAGVVSPAMVIIVSLAAVASFMIPNYSSSITIRFLRYPLIILGGVFGLPGVFWGLLFILLHLASLRSFGVPYLYPVAPGVPSEWHDIFVKAPQWMMDYRPRLFRTRKLIRQAPGQRPQHPGGSSGQGDDPERAGEENSPQLSPQGEQPGAGR